MYCPKKFDEQDKKVTNKEESKDVNTAKKDESKEEKLNAVKSNDEVTKEEEESKTKKDELNEFKNYATHDLCFIFKSQLKMTTDNKIKSYQLLYSASMNSFESYIPLDENPIDSEKIKSIELKINKSLGTRNELSFKRYKTCKWCSESVLVNNQKIVCAFWNQDFIVNDINSVKEYSLDNLKKIGKWNDCVCFNQFNNLLSFIKTSFLIKKNTNLLKFHQESLQRKFVCMPYDKVLLPDFYKDELLKSSSWRS